MGWFEDQRKRATEAMTEGAKDAATQAGKKAVSAAWASLTGLVRGAAERFAKATDDALSAAESHLDEREQAQSTAREQAERQAQARREEAEARRQAVLDREARAREELARLKQQAKGVDAVESDDPGGPETR